MTYKLSWYVPEQILNLTLDGQLAYQELEEINRNVLEILDNHKGKVSILIDAGNLKTGYQTADQLRDTQKYMDHSQVAWAIVVSNSKLNRLITLMAFNLSRVSLKQFNDFQKAEAYLTQRGFLTA